MRTMHGTLRLTGNMCRLLLTALLVAFPGMDRGGNAVASREARPGGYTGSASCRECHEKFHTLWATSRHGLAMQPYSEKFANEYLTPQPGDIPIQGNRYRFDLKQGAVVESAAGHKNIHAVSYVMGGKYVYFFLTPLERGRLQVLPVAYDMRSKSWYDTTASFMRHVAVETDRPVTWRDPLLTFNAACYGCHVSQVSTNYNPQTDTYSSTWAEPGINCETCHGPAGDHVKAARAIPKGAPLKEPRIISTKKMTHEQRNHLCATCHTKGGALTTEFIPGNRYYDHFDLATLENPDFYPDGRDLGENYTYTSWSMAPCFKAEKLDCVHCHTSSGRYRYKKERFNEACLPCHEKQVKNPAAHTHHRPESEGSRCVSCHMPKTEFARMDRSDHSMRPPMPAATIRFKSPNACNICHQDKDAAWADTFVRQWRSRDYQVPVLRAAGLIETGRLRDWRRLDEMLAYIAGANRDEVFAASLLRLIVLCRDERKWPVVIKALSDPSPLVRAAAAEGLQGHVTPDSVAALIRGTEDDYRLVRIRSASSLAMLPLKYIPEQDREKVRHAMRELQASFLAHPDDSGSNYNLGNYFLNVGEFDKAATSFETAIRLRPDVVTPYVNASIAYSNLGDREKAGERLQKALEIEPANAAAHLNLGLLKIEQGSMEEAEHALRAALTANPGMAQAAYNLCILLGRSRPDEATGFCRKASELRPDEPRYAYAFAYVLTQRGDYDEAARILATTIQKHPAYLDAAVLLQRITDESREHKGKRGISSQ